MPVITFVSSKGGAGKTTSAILMATQLGKRFKVTVIDTDPEAPVVTWSKRRSPGENLTILASSGEASIATEIDMADRTSDFVFVDLAGGLNQLASQAAAQSDLLIIPTQEDQRGVNDICATINWLKTVKTRSSQSAEYRVLICQTQIENRSSYEDIINKHLRAEAYCLSSEVRSHHLYKKMYHLGGDLESLPLRFGDETNSLILESNSLCAEILRHLRNQGLLAKRWNVRRDFLSKKTQISLRMSQASYAEFSRICSAERYTNGELIDVLLREYKRSRQENKHPL